MIKLSPSKLNLLNDCPLCFWKAYAAKVPKPRGIFPSLPGGMDRVIKGYFDMHRVSGILPMEVEGIIPAKTLLMSDLPLMNKWRNWRSGLTTYIEDLDVELIGALDDCLVGEAGYMPLDYKTKGSKPKDSGVQYYQTQLDCYELMLNYNGYDTCGKSYLLYFYPIGGAAIEKDAIVQGEMALNFGIELYEIETDIDRALALIEKAVKVRTSNKPPKANPDCEMCNYVSLSEALKKGGK